MFNIVLNKPLVNFFRVNDKNNSGVAGLNQIISKLWKPFRAIRSSDKYDLRFQVLRFDVELLLKVELPLEVELLFELELLLEV